MSSIITPNQNILFMKVGVHANEPLDEIIARKRKEIEDAGFALWGYGGNTCHPKTKVQPFAKEAKKQGQTIYLCMESMDSNHFAQQVRAAEYSADGENYEKIPDAINVLGSRYALAIKNLHEDDIEIPLDKTKVAIGECKGRLGSNYIKGRVDKACLTFSEDINEQTDSDDENNKKISLVAELCEPYAYFLKN